MNEASWPRLSIITPSFNQAKYLERTIVSVLGQNYENLEYIVLDGGSTDGSVAILRKYSDRITAWESGPDEGQADAIYHGFEMATGDIIAWVNSDDYYLEEAFSAVGDYFRKNPSASWLIGNGILVDMDGKELLKLYSPRITFDNLLFFGGAFNQPSLFMKREAFFACGGFDRALKFCFDLDLVLNLARKLGPPGQIDSFLSAFRYHPESKTSTLATTRLQESACIRTGKYRALTGNRFLYGWKKRKNIILLFLHRLRTSGIIPYLNFILSQKTYRNRYA